MPMKILFDKAQWMMSADGAYLMIRTDRRSATAFCDEMKEGKVYEADLKEHRQKRSLDANAYAWVLLGKLANKVGLPKEEVYREFIKDVGGNYEILPIRNDAVDKWISCWQQKGIGWVCDIIGESKLDGYTNVISYYGSSTYDGSQMSKLINLIVEECKQQNIEVMTPAELAMLMDGWET